MYRDVLGPGLGAPRSRPPLARASSEGGEEMYDPTSGGYEDRIRGYPGHRAQHNISISGNLQYHRIATKHCYNIIVVVIIH